MAPEVKNNGGTFNNREKPIQVRASNITAAKGKVSLKFIIDETIWI